jgi:ferric-dicitrate binding protein FerR (iron transport regulator)
MLSKRTQRVVAVLALVSVSACTVWKPIPAAPPAADLPDQVRVTLETGEQVTLRDASVIGDSLVVGREGKDGPMREYPFRDVRELEAGSRSVGRTVLLGVGIVAAGIALLWVGLWVGCNAGWGTCS